ncbi:hypothetical protein GBAR_LOCUS24151, partial [Geodia barretti]
TCKRRGSGSALDGAHQYDYVDSNLINPRTTTHGATHRLAVDQNSFAVAVQDEPLQNASGSIPSQQDDIEPEYFSISHSLPATTAVSNGGEDNELMTNAALY